MVHATVAQVTPSDTQPESREYVFVYDKNIDQRVERFGQARGVKQGHAVFYDFQNEKLVIATRRLSAQKAESEGIQGKHRAADENLITFSTVFGVQPRVAIKNQMKIKQVDPSKRPSIWRAFRIYQAYVKQYE